MVADPGALPVGELATDDDADAEGGNGGSGLSGAGVGRSVTSTRSAHPARAGGFPSSAEPSSSPAIAQPAPQQDVARSVMDIFAGAPKPVERDPWVVIPRPPSSAATAAGRKVTRATSMAVGMTLGGAAGAGTSSATIGRSSLRPPAGAGMRLSRIVDAVIDSPQPGGDGAASDPPSDEGGPPPALERALRRGLSDSSIRTTFTQHGGEEAHAGPAAGPAPPPPDRESVLQTLSRKVQAFRFVASTATATAARGEAGAERPSRPQTPTGRGKAKAEPATPRRSPPKPIPQARARNEGESEGVGANTSLFGLSSWTAAYDELDEAERPVGAPYFAGSPREEGFIQRNWTREREF